MFIRISEAIAFLFEIIYLIWIRSEKKRAISVQQRVIHHCAMCSRFCLIVFFFFLLLFFSQNVSQTPRILLFDVQHGAQMKIKPRVRYTNTELWRKIFFFPPQVYFRSINFAKILFSLILMQTRYFAPIRFNIFILNLSSIFFFIIELL